MLGGMKDLSNEQFGRLTVLGLAEIKRYKSTKNMQTKAYWFCDCKCGNTKTIRGEHLTSGKIVSCGCRGAEAAREAHTTHGLTGTPEYRSWLNMRQRVLNPDDHHKKYYMGIDFGYDWNSFEQFLKDMGPKPTPRHELDRIDPFGPYCRENCRWATRKEQMQNLKKHYV